MTRGWASILISRSGPPIPRTASGARHARTMPTPFITRNAELACGRLAAIGPLGENCDAGRRRAQRDGFEWLRGACLASDIPVIALTAGYEPTTVAKILNAGADDVIQVGTERSLIIARVRAVLRRYAPAAASRNVASTAR